MLWQLYFCLKPERVECRNWCELFASEYGLKFNEMKSVLLFLNQSVSDLIHILRICLNDMPIPIKTSYRCLRHIITTNLSDNQDIRCQLISLIARFMGPTWGPSGADRTQVGPVLAPGTLLSGMFFVCLGFLLLLWTVKDVATCLCSYEVKLVLLMRYCGSMYTLSVCCKYTKKQYYHMGVAYNNVFKWFFWLFSFMVSMNEYMPQKTV